MRRRSTKIAAALLSAMLVLQSGIGTADMSLVQRVQAAEQTTEAAVQTQAETQMEVQTQALTEAQTQAPTEAQTQAPTEAQTQAPTEAQTQAPTEAQTQAPTEVQTQAPTEAQTQAPTEAQTQAPTEAQTQASTEAQTQKQSEKETEKETATEPAETERSERVNAGSKMKASQLISSLKNVLPYLLAAKTVQLPDQLVEALGVDASEENTLVLQGEEGAAATAELKQFALKLADAKTSSNVKVINLYADKDGKLDTAQLDQQFKNQVIDVTKQYVVINVIADHADQNLTFSGYDMVLSGSSVKYQDETQPGDILYNFAALDGEKYTAYKGTLTLSGNLQGTFLAPEADVKINADLAGAVFAETITVADSVESLLHIVFAEGKAIETEAATESETAAVTEAVTESETAKATEAVTESETAKETEAVIENETAEATEEVTESEAAKETETATESETAKETEVVTEIVIETEAISEAESEEIPGEELLDLLIEQEVEPIQPVALTPQGEGETAQETTLTLSVIDEEDKVVPSAVFVVKDQDKKVLTDEQGQPLYYISYAGTETNVKMDLDLKKLVEQIKDTESHTYYLSQLRTAAGYQIDTMEHSFTIESGTVFFDKTENTENQDKISVTYVRELTIKNKKIQQTAQAGTLKITGKTYYKNVLLTGEQPNTRYVALFADETLTQRVSAVLPLEYEPGKTETGTAEFAELASQEEARTYYLAQTDEFGTVIPAEEEAAVVQAEEENTAANTLDYQIWVGDAAGSKIEFAKQTPESTDTEPKQARIDFYLDQIGYTTESGYSYPAELTVTKKIFDAAGAALPTDETFYFNVYPIEAGKTELGKAVFEKPQAIVMKQSAEASATVSLKMNAASGSFAIREVDQSGTILTADSTGFVYTISYPENPDGTFTVFCNSAVDDKGQFTGVTEPVKLTIENRRTDSVVKLQAEDKEDGKLLSGISLVIKNKAGKVVLINDKKVMTSAAEPIELKNVLTIGEAYYLSALQAPSGYAAAPDVAFTVGRSGETIVSLQYSKLKTTEYKLTLSKQVYQGKYPLCTNDPKNQFAPKGAYTFYAALFADSARTQKVSDVQKITVSGFAGTTDFMNLEKDKTYYIGETDEYGQLKKSTSEVAVKYAAKGVVTMSAKEKTSIIQNAYSSRPEGYCYTGTLTIVKKVTDAAGNAASVNETFYAGIYRNADYSDKPTVMKIKLEDSSSNFGKGTIKLFGNKDSVYYIAEVDAKGNRITDSSNFAYTVKIDQPTATISKGTNTTVTITNQAKSTKATLYLTKKVYNGTEQQTVNETFYAGLFKDAAFTKPYTKPIAMKLENKSELTLKLSLNLGTASSTKIYIAEVDADGNVIKDEKNFGYQIRMVNSTVEFTQERREVQTIILNSKYGTTSSNDWNDIFDKDGNDGGSMDGGYWGVSGNGDASESTAAQTGDDTPILFYGLLMCLALVVLIVLLVFFRKKRN